MVRKEKDSAGNLCDQCKKGCTTRMILDHASDICHAPQDCLLRIHTEQEGVDFVIDYSGAVSGESDVLPGTAYFLRHMG